MLLESLPGEDLDLRPRRTVLQAPPAELTSLIRIGEPVVYDAVALAEAGQQPLDPQVRILLDEFSFSLVRLPVTIRPTEATTVRFLTVEVQLTAVGQNPTCWSLDPDQITDEVKVSTGVSFNGKLTVKLAEIGSADTKNQEYIVRQPRVSSFSVGLHDPSWEFNPTASHPLRGVQLLHLVVKAPLGQGWLGDVSIGADVVSRHVLWNTRAFRPDGRQQVAEFAGPAGKTS
jgi:hypothetical protein